MFLSISILDPGTLGSCPRPSCELTRQEIQSSDDPFTRTQVQSIYI